MNQTVAPDSARPRPTAPPGRQDRFSLSRWFALVAFVSIATLAVAIGVLLDRFVANRMVAQEALLTQEFVNSLLIVETPLADYVADPSPRLESQMAASFRHIEKMPDVLRANIYDHAERVVWSSDRAMIGRSFGPNQDLRRALAGAVSATREEHHDTHELKPEHERLPDAQQMFIEIYVPLRLPDSGTVIGAFEFYKRPQALERALSELRAYIIVGATVGGLLLFAALMGLVRRADHTIRAQHRRIIDQETLAALGEMSGAVAHGIRNPLASIRSSAELIPGSTPERIREASDDIVAQADRLEAWVRELLSYTQPLAAADRRVALAPVVRDCLDALDRELSRRGIRTRAAVADDLPAVRGDAMLLGQVLTSLMTNAIEAMPENGQLVVTGRRDDEPGRVLLEVRDSGPGLTAEQVRRIGQPFYTTKPRGLGVGFALARRMVERCGGRLEIDSRPGAGTVVRLQLEAA